MANQPTSPPTYPKKNAFLENPLVDPRQKIITMALSNATSPNFTTVARSLSTVKRPSAMRFRCQSKGNINSLACWEIFCSLLSKRNAIGQAVKEDGILQKYARFANSVRWSWPMSRGEHVAHAESVETWKHRKLHVSKPLVVMKEDTWMSSNHSYTNCWI